MSNKLNPFEDQLKKAAEKHTVPYDAGQWTQLEQKLNASSSAGISWGKWGLVTAAVIVLAFGASTFLEDPIDSTNVSVVDFVSEEESKKVSENSIPENSDTFTENISENEGTASVVEAKEFEEPTPEVTSKSQEPEPTVQPEKPQVETIVAAASQTTSEVITEKVGAVSKVETPKIILKSASICAGTELKASLDSDEFTELEWDLGNGKTEVSLNLNHVYLNPGTYQIKAFIKELNTYTEETTVIVKPKPDASFTIRENLEREMIPVKYISANTGGEKSYAWTLGDGTVLKGEGISHIYRKTGDYEVSLRVMNKYGCFWTNFQRVTIENEFNLLAPNSFSPNGDGVNDSWIPVALTSGYYNFELKVYDRNSTLIFETSDPEQTFDGKSRGKLSPSGEIFIWKASTLDANNVRQEFGGTVISIY